MDPLPDVDRTFYKGIRALEALAKSPEPCGVTEIATSLGYTKSNAHRILKGLVALGYAKPSQEKGRYEITSRMWEIGYHFFRKLDIPRLCAPYTKKLLDQTGETIVISILEDRDVLFVSVLESSHAIRAYAGIGQRAPAHCVATGQAQIAWASNNTVEAIKNNLIALTGSTITMPEIMDRRLSEIRAQGFAISTGEWADNMNAVAAPIRDATGNVVVAIGLSGPADRLDHATCLRHSVPLRDAAREISRHLGYYGTDMP